LYKFIGFIFSVLCLTGLSSCLTGNQKNFKFALINDDFYFSGSKVLIQGKSRLPPAKNPDVIESPGHTAEKAYLTLKTRRELCIEKALENAHSKWLLLTKKKPADQFIRISQLRNKEVSDYSGCLDNAKVLHQFYDTSDSCRVAVVYSCRPEKY
jgi:hypothetical protein